MTNHVDHLFQAPTYSKFCLVMACAFVLNGCGEFAYKRGANAADLETTKKSCLAKGGDNAAIDQCMESSGWVIQKFNEPDPVMEATYTPDNRNVASAVTSQSAATPSTSGPATSQLTTGKPGSIDNAASTNAKGNVQSASMAQPAAAAQAADPMDTFKVSSWWKIGGSPDAMKVAIESCVTTLGEAHRPDIKTQDVTRGMLVCMLDKGWRGLRAK